MSVKINLISIVFVAVLILCGVGCMKPPEDSTPASEPSLQTQPPQHPTKRISGKIISIDEDSFAIAGYSKGANF